MQYYPQNCFNGKIDVINIWTDVKENNIITLDGAANDMADQELLDIKGGNNAKLVNFPTRAVTGIDWDGKTTNFVLDPRAYAAVHFHEDDLYDSNWETDFKLKVPDEWESGVYAAYLRSEDDDKEFYVPFMLRAAKGKEKKCVFLVSTATYAAYANMNLRVTAQFNELIHGRLF